MKGIRRLKPSPSFFTQRHDLLWIILLIAALLFIIFAWPAPASGAFVAQSATIVPTALPTITATAIPAQFLVSTDQTSGIICGSVVLVLIIVGGTFIILGRKNGSSAAH
jgi:hypothetical protein